MGAAVWRDEEGHLRCRRSPGGTAWYVHVPRTYVFELTEEPPSAEPPPAEPPEVEAAAAATDEDEGPAPTVLGPETVAAGRVAVGRIDPETAESIIRFLIRERRQRDEEEPSAAPAADDTAEDAPTASDEES
ncbi:MAG: hypothetical protein RBU45_09340 [Myxococcota bacterium]|jgi:hypothetical protein|nr:hypothetical protein [Myxococcota bacterium]